MIPEQEDTEWVGILESCYPPEDMHAKMAIGYKSPCVWQYSLEAFYVVGKQWRGCHIFETKIQGLVLEDKPL